ncbi:esterase/lipase family protein [Anthocerotibacter panamensis]|uniref:esterase/lipase family protein n=1 Tax=Anthocerotibacter panamensis TaxID=2857077 RepID=UPI001C403130|nr:lipase [Anthocerotibacter panamensis]
MGIPTVIIPGYLASAREYLPLTHDLRTLRLSALVVPLSYRSWFATLGGKPVTPILQTMAQTIEQACKVYRTEQVHLVGHSAGGWIARILMGEKNYDGYTWGWHKRVKTLVTLGTPHLSQERYTLTNMNFVNSTYPGAFHPGVQYVCVAGRAVYGEHNWFARQSYRMTAGRSDCWGDGITPIECAHLTGANNLTLEKIFHSPRRNRLWYGSPDVLASWVDYLKGD